MPPARAAGSLNHLPKFKDAPEPPFGVPVWRGQVADAARENGHYVSPEGVVIFDHRHDAVMRIDRRPMTGRPGRNVAVDLARCIAP
jgi:hypothetical protein